MEVGRTDHENRKQTLKTLKVLYDIKLVTKTRLEDVAANL